MSSNIIITLLTLFSSPLQHSFWGSVLYDQSNGVSVRVATINGTSEIYGAFGPASINKTENNLFSDSRDATAAPAEPPPTET